MIDRAHKPATVEMYPSRWRRSAAVVTALAATAALGACVPQERGGTSPIPGERLGVVYITTVPPGLNVRLTSQTSAGPPAHVEQLGKSEKSGPSPLKVSVSYKPGSGTQMLVKGYLSEAPRPNQTVTLGCEVWADGEHLHNQDDTTPVGDFNKQTAFVLCNFIEDLAPPLPGK